MNKKLIDFIRHYMDERDLSRNELARKMRIAPATLGNILNGHTENPDRKFFLELSIVTGVSEAELRMLAYPGMTYDLRAIPEESRRSFLEYMALPEDVRNTITAITGRKE